MTRFLSAALGAAEPTFSQSIQQLEHAAGRPSADIRLTSEIMQHMRRKIAELGLDPDDTTNTVLQRVQQFLAKHDAPKKVFALKSSVAKRLLKKKVPKNAMKQLGYRSADSMLKHETIGALYAAALIAEPDSWQRSFRD